MRASGNIKNHKIQTLNINNSMPSVSQRIDCVTIGV